METPTQTKPAKSETTLTDLPVLKFHVLGPMEGTYSDEMAKLVKYALEPLINCLVARIDIVLHEDHNEVLHAIDEQVPGEINLLIQPIANRNSSKLGDVVLAHIEEVLEHLTILAGARLSVESYLAAGDQDLLKEENFHKITAIYCHSASLNQCLETIKAIQRANPNVKIIHPSSTAQAAIEAKQNPNSVAVCSKLAAKLNEIPISENPITPSEGNHTTFLIIGDEKDANNPVTNEIAQTLGTTVMYPGAKMSKLTENEAKENSKIHFQTKLEISDEPDTLYLLVEKLTKLGVNFNSVDVISKNGIVDCYLAGDISSENEQQLKEILNEQKIKYDLYFQIGSVGVQENLETNNKVEENQDLTEVPTQVKTLNNFARTETFYNCVSTERTIPNTPGALLEALDQLKNQNTGKINYDYMSIQGSANGKTATLKATGNTQNQTS